MVKEKKSKAKGKSSLVAYCGLYCGACGKYKKGKCPGCARNEKATWCKIRTCCIDNHYKTCADCRTYSDSRDCKNMNNLMSKVFAVFFNSNRNACIDEIRKSGMAKFADKMASEDRQSLPR